MVHLGDICQINGAEIELVGLRKYKVYKYVFPNGKIYIGVTSLTIEERRDNGYQHNKSLQKAIREYGWRGFEHDILRDGLTKEEAFNLEREMIARFDATNPENGYNVSYGGKSTFAGLKHTEEVKKRLSNDRRGIPKTEEAKKNMRIAHAKERKPVVAIDDNGDVVGWYRSLGDAAEFVKGYRSNIMRACTNSAKKYKGYYWREVKRGDEVG